MKKTVTPKGPNPNQSLPDSKLLDIYIRNNKKQAILVHTPRRANGETLSRLITQRMGIPRSSQVLYHNGLRVDL